MSRLLSRFQKNAELADWRGATLAIMRTLIQAADREVVEEWKWMGTPVWSHGGIICAGATYKLDDFDAAVERAYAMTIEVLRSNQVSENGNREFGLRDPDGWTTVITSALP